MKIAQLRGPIEAILLLRRSPIVRISAVNLVPPLAAIVVSPVLARELGASGRGLYAALTMSVIVIGQISTFGAQESLSYGVAQRGLSPHAALRLVPCSLLPSSVIGFTLYGVFCVAIDAKGAGLSAPEIVALGAAIPIQVAASMLLGIALGSGNIKAANSIRLMPTILRAVSTVVLCIVATVSPWLAAAILVGSPSIGILRALLLIRRSPMEDSGSDRVPTDHRIDRFGLLDMWHFALLAFPGVLAASSIAKIDQVIGLPLIGSQELGFYAVAVSFAELPLSVAAACRAYVIGVRADAQDLGTQKRAVRVVFTGTVVACVGAICVTKPVIVAMFGEEFDRAVLPSIILLFGTAVYSLGASLTGVLLSLGCVKAQSSALLAGAAVSVILLVSMRDMGAVGAALASTIGYSTTTAIALCAIKRHTDEPKLSTFVLARWSDIRRL